MLSLWSLGGLAAICIGARFFVREPLLQAALEITSAISLYTVLDLQQAKGRSRVPGDLIYPIGFGLALIGVMLFVYAWHPLVLFAGWEVVSIAGWSLIAFAKGISRHSLEAAFIAFVINRIGDAFWLAGFFSEGKFPEGLWIGILVKAGIFPFTFWLIQAMFAPAPVSALLHSALIVGMAAYMPLKYPTLTHRLPAWSMEVIWGAALGAALGAVLSRSPKATLAWTTGAHLAMVIFLSLEPPRALSYLLHHSYLKAALFLLLGSAQKEGGFTSYSTILWISLATFLTASGSYDKRLLVIEALTAMALGRAWRRLGYQQKGSFLSPASVFPFILGVRAAFLSGASLRLSWEALVPLLSLGAGMLYHHPFKLRLDVWLLKGNELLLSLWLQISRLSIKVEGLLELFYKKLAETAVRGGNIFAELESYVARRGWPFVARQFRRGISFLAGEGMHTSYAQALSWGLLVSLLVSMLWRLLF
ncbi:MAG: proton-conducting transporter membrane subunit [Bacteroidia bacterium]|nr:proton-conducting transporter membrane subunit [Bacteroidia bacterium]